jgi:hypothetical protein
VYPYFIVYVSKTEHFTPRLPNQTCCAGTPITPNSILIGPAMEKVKKKINNNKQNSAIAIRVQDQLVALLPRTQRFKAVLASLLSSPHGGSMHVI